MAQNDIEVEKIAALARLDIDAAEAEALGTQFARILEQFQVLAALDVEGVEPRLGGLDASATSNVQRDDVPRPSYPVEAMLANAPARVGDFYSVPKTVGGDE